MKKQMIVTLAVLAILSVQVAVADPHGHGHEENAHAGEEADNHGHEEGVIHMDAAQIAKAGIQTASVVSATVAESIRVPGQIVLADDRRAIVSTRASGTVQQVVKNMGDMVAAGETLALLESPQIAEVAAEYLAALQAEKLAKTVFAREEKLWTEKVTAEQDYLQARHAHQEAKIRLNLALQKLRAAGQSPEDAARGGVYALTSPIAGKVIRRDLTLGATIDNGYQAFEVADTGILWVEAAIPSAQLAEISEQQAVTVTDAARTASGTIVFISPAIDAATRTGKAVIALPNPDGVWRAGGFANVLLPSGAGTSDLSVPSAALQKIEGKTVVFVQTDEGFEVREVETGADNGDQVVVTQGLAVGENVATDNAFILKAELGKSEAEHAH